MTSEVKTLKPLHENRFSEMSPEWRHKYFPVIKSINSLVEVKRNPPKERKVTFRKKIMFDNYFEEMVFPRAKKIYFDAFEAEVYPKLKKQFLDKWVYNGHPEIAEFLESESDTEDEDDFVKIIRRKKRKDLENPLTFGLGKHS